MADKRSFTGLVGRWGMVPVLTVALFVAGALLGPLDEARAWSGTFTSTGGLDITDNGVANPYPSTVEVSGLPAEARILDMEVTIRGLSHTYPGDVDVLLVAPDGQRSILFSDAGDTYDVSDVTLKFDDDATATLTSWEQISSSTYKPVDLDDGLPESFQGVQPDGPYEASLRQFRNADPNGTWKLYVKDDAPPDAGAISGFSLDIVTRIPPQCDDGEDNDGDGKTDSGGENPDPGCQSHVDNSEDSDKVFTVDTTADGRDASPGDGLCDADATAAGAQCTLRAAIEETSATSAPDGVALPAGRYELAAANGSLKITDAVTLVGAGARRTTISGGENFGSRVLSVLGYHFEAQVSGVTITGGRGQEGGGIYSEASLTFRETAVVGNSAEYGGGAIYSLYGHLKIIDSTIAGNTAPGGIGGVFQNDGPITIVNSTISGNTASGEGGGLVVLGVPSVLKMTNSTVASNTSSGAGGGVYASFGATATIENSIVWGNSSSDCYASDDAYNKGTITSGGGNVSGDASCGFTQTDDQQNTDPLLGPLADNGGPTDTRAPAEGSPVLDVGSASTCPATDQRGVARPQEGDGVGGAACDVGAYELRFAGPTVNHDSYEAPQDGTLSVPAPGPLANDTDPEDDALSAVMVSDVSHGALGLSADGSFTYTPAAGFVGRDTFTYKATDGTSSSGVATVEILVKDDVKPTVESVAPAGRKVPRTANVTATFSEAMDAETIDTATVKLTKKGTRSPVTATVSYDPAKMKATLDPAKSLVKGATYTAAVSTGARDVAGNALAATKTWSFTVRR